MALLEDDNVCCVCEVPVRRWLAGVPPYYCPACYTTYSADILTQPRPVTWVYWLMNEEKQRRKRRNRRVQNGVSLTAVDIQTVYGVV